MANSASTSVPPPQSETIRRLAGTAEAVAALLVAFEVMPQVNQKHALEACAGMAGGLACDLAALTGTAAPYDAAPEQETLEDIFNDTGCAIEILRDLLKVAKRECPEEADRTCKAGSVIRAAGRYVDDIETLNERLFARQAAAARAEKGGA